ncbi:MAG TPA: phosphotransferase family protein [Rhizomicrobium sp.]|jgi:aminoglycoside phosphotransferase (APT) family kinase protein|nr:phosphotransferase family protein [Rhizomicrobium sp.]
MAEELPQTVVPRGDQDWQSFLSLAALSAWMDGQGLPRGSIENAHLLGGGTQNILLKFDRAGRSFVLRRPPKHLRANSNETMRREARVLAALAGTDVRHPALIAACGDESVLGAAFYLMEPVEGFTPREEMPPLHASDPAIRRAMGFEMVDAIAALSKVDYAARGLEGLGKLDKFLDRQVGRWRGQLESYAEFPGWPGLSGIPGVDEVGAWLAKHQPQSFVPGIIHGDFHFGNVLFDRHSAKLTAMVDWELTTLGDPLIDLGWLLSAWPEDGAELGPVKPWSGFPSRAEIVERYARATVRDVSHADWYEVLACYKLGAILEGTYARACAGRAPKATGDFLHASTIALFTRALKKIA